jgi:Ca2+-dependent lipid-binding protein
MRGSIKIRIIGAVLDSDKDAIGKMDPYALLEIGSQKFKTTIAKGMGLNPSWNEEFIFNVNGDEDLKITIYDSDIGKDDFLGQ